MRIAVNTRMLIPGKMEGIGYFTYECMKRMTHDHPEHSFVFIFDRPFDPTFISSENVSAVYASPPARHPLLWYLWYEWSLPPVLRKAKADLFIGTDGYLSLSSGITSIAVMHDINFEHYPLGIPLLSRLYYRHYFPKYARQARRIAAVSEFTKNDVAGTYDVDPSKIDVVYNGAGENFRPVNDEVKEEVRKRFSGGSSYFLFVGALHQRKNIANLLRAFDEFKSRSSNTVKLVLAGQRRWWTNEMEEVYRNMKFRESVVFTGRLETKDLEELSAAALAMVYVSTFEGFGIPIVEAMYCDVPVITSNVTSMPEIAGDAALFCNPFSQDSICEAMLQMNEDERLRYSLIEKGRIRREKFTWQKTADSLWNCIEKTMQ